MVFLCVLPPFISGPLQQETRPDSLLSLFGVSPQTQRLLLWPGLHPALL